MNQSYCYSFRFCCDPGFNDRREIASLRRFVREAQIDDVAVFCNVEELNTGHMTEEEQETIWLRLLCDVQAALAPEGVQLSVNHWHSLMHADLGKTLPQSQPFRRMVDMDGREADLCVCPMCERWQTYFAGLYARYAALSPHILWVEDDFRLHNHDPLRWGGCFCPAHMREYARRAGKPELTREEFVRGILQPGAVHPYRKIWLDVNRETMTALAARIGQAVRQLAEDDLLHLAEHLRRKLILFLFHHAASRYFDSYTQPPSGSRSSAQRASMACSVAMRFPSVSVSRCA